MATFVLTGLFGPSSLVGKQRRWGGDLTQVWRREWAGARGAWGGVARPKGCVRSRIVAPHRLCTSKEETDPPGCCTCPGGVTVAKAGRLRHSNVDRPCVLEGDSGELAEADDRWQEEETQDSLQLWGSDLSIQMGHFLGGQSWSTSGRRTRMGRSWDTRGTALCPGKAPRCFLCRVVTVTYARGNSFLV